jgi:hypothetical protein
MFHFSLWGREWLPATIAENLGRLRENPVLLAELRELLNLKLDLAPKSLCRSFVHWNCPPNIPGTRFWPLSESGDWIASGTSGKVFYGCRKFKQTSCLSRLIKLKAIILPLPCTTITRSAPRCFIGNRRARPPRKHLREDGISTIGSVVQPYCYSFDRKSAGMVWRGRTLFLDPQITLAIKVAVR